MDRPRFGIDRRAAWAATIAATVIITLQLAGKATRDALFLSTFGVAALPPMVIAAAVLSAVLTVVLARVMARSRPARLVPRLFGLSGLLLLAEWALVPTAPRATAVLVYLHLTGLGAILVSGFWAIVNERFDPRTAKRTIGQITAGGSVGGLLGGLLPERVGSSFPLTTMLPILALLTLFASLLALQIERGSPATPPEEDASDAGGILTGGRVIGASTYLTALALLVALTSSAEAVIDYVFKARVSAAATSGEELLRLFAAFYTVTALAGILIQVTALPALLVRLGIARSASLLPAGLSAGAAAALLVPGLVSIILARGMEVVFRSSLFRAAYELLFTPVAPLEKRASKLLLDVGAARVGDVIGGSLVLGVLALTSAHTGKILLVTTIVLSGLALLVARRLHLGYIAALEGTLHRRAGGLPDRVEDDAAALLQTVGGFDISGLRPRLTLGISPEQPAGQSQGSPAAQPAARVPAGESPLSVAIRGGKPEEVRRTLAEHAPGPDEVEAVIALLAWDAVAPAAVRSLCKVASASTDRLLAHLLDPDEDFAVRRRLVNVLASCPSPEVFEGLFQALSDRRFEVRYRAGRALSRLAGEIPNVQVNRDRVLELVLKEMGVDRGIWESRQLIDVADEVSSPMESEVLRERVSRSLEHLFTLLSLIFPRETLRLAFHALHTEDAYLRGTALEYLETVLPEIVWARLLPLLGHGEVPVGSARGSAEALRDLLASRESISLALARVREREGT
ncbi:MAG TPA: HEAT repeat domain-containing protein [Gemmatimonadales bacterium]|nr:HEAT repeat domain-containing protein [Gemmatimonadales bacterium]